MEDDAECASLPKLTELVRLLNLTKLVKKPSNLTRTGKEKPGNALNLLASGGTLRKRILKRDPSDLRKRKALEMRWLIGVEIARSIDDYENCFISRFRSSGRMPSDLIFHLDVL